MPFSTVGRYFKNSCCKGHKVTRTSRYVLHFEASLEKQKASCAILAGEQLFVIAFPYMLQSIKNYIAEQKRKAQSYGILVLKKSLFNCPISCKLNWTTSLCFFFLVAQHLKEKFGGRKNSRSFLISHQSFVNFLIHVIGNAPGQKRSCVIDMNTGKHASQASFLQEITKN